MNITLSHALSHPPDTRDRQVVRIPAPGELRALALVDRLSFRIGLWLLRRSQRPRRLRNAERRPARPLFLDEEHVGRREASTILAYHLQRHLN